MNKELRIKDRLMHIEIEYMNGYKEEYEQVRHYDFVERGAFLKVSRAYSGVLYINTNKILKVRELA